MAPAEWRCRCAVVPGKAPEDRRGPPPERWKRFNNLRGSDGGAGCRITTPSQPPLLPTAPPRSCVRLPLEFREFSRASSAACKLTFAVGMLRLGAGGGGLKLHTAWYNSSTPALCAALPRGIIQLLRYAGSCISKMEQFPMNSAHQEPTAHPCCVFVWQTETNYGLKNFFYSRSSTGRNNCEIGEGGSGVPYQRPDAIRAAQRHRAGTNAARVGAGQAIRKR